MPRNLTPQDIAAFQERLCDAAERLFAEKGADAVTIRDLASAVGVSPMTPYRYFKDKDAILAAVRARAFNSFADVLEAAFDAHSRSLSDQSAAVAHAYVDFALRRREAYKLMFEVNQPGEAAYPELVAAGERARATMTRHLKREHAAGHFEGDADMVGHMFWSAMHGALMLHFAGKLPPGMDVSRLIAATLGAIDIRRPQVRAILDDSEVA